MKPHPLLQWLMTIPDDVPKETRRYFLYWKVFYFLGAITHFMALVMLALAGVTFMAWFNVVSVPVFVLAFIMLRYGRYRLPFWLVNLELTAHGIAATICVGPEVGLQCYIFPVAVLVFVQPFYSLRVSVLLAGANLVILALLMYFVTGRPPVYQLSDFWLVAATVTTWTLFPATLIAMVLPFIAEARRAEKALEAAYDESESLLLNILPKPIAERLKRGSGKIADDHDRVAVLFADIVGFTNLSDRLPPATVVDLLDQVFNAFDTLAEKYGVEKIKTIGDAYMVVAGVPTAQDEPEAIIARMALDIRDAVERFTLPDTGEPMQVRIGINSGRVVAGVIGQRKFAYDLWGDAVNVAARMEATGEPGKIQLPESMARQLADRFNFEPRGTVEVKGKGTMKTVFLTGAKAAT
jgi:class 3 adenylate cyclase